MEISRLEMFCLMVAFFILLWDAIRMQLSGSLRTRFSGQFDVYVHFGCVKFGPVNLESGEMFASLVP